MPKNTKNICFKFNRQSSPTVIKSGIMFTIEMYKNPPLVNGNIQLVTSPARSAELHERANIAPIIPANAVINFNLFKKNN